MTKLTIGLPVYNAMPFLVESLESLLRQTDSDFTILAIDDGSTDGGLKYLQSVRDSRLRIVTQANRGLTFTLNRMLREVNTPWLTRHDADDIASLDRVAVTKRYIEQFPKGGMFYSDARYYQDGRSVGSFRTTRAAPERLRKITKSGYLLSICHPTVTLNVEKTIAVGGYRFNLHVEDIDLWWRMVLSHDVHYIPKVTAYFRHNTSSVSTANLESQSVNTLYVQYLLISHLHGWPALSHNLVHAHLAQDIDRPRLKFREHMRRANICYGKKQYPDACKHLARAAIASPSHLASRVLYEFRDRKVAVLGEDPSKFLLQRDVLWPKAEDQTNSA